MHQPSKMATHESKQQETESIEHYFDRILKTSRIQTRENATKGNSFFNSENIVWYAPQ